MSGSAGESHTIRVSAQTWERLQQLATPFRGSERGTPDRVIAWLLDEHEKALDPHSRRVKP